MEQFQYISCCSLSLLRTVDRARNWMFQYISCCSLSDAPPADTDVTLKFQYISCCSLSFTIYIFPIRNFCFNTSHVVVYRAGWFSRIDLAMFQYISCCSLSTFILKSLSCLQVSIHLMLQFIEKWVTSLDKERRFQYISCCSLSLRKNTYILRIRVSIHLMLQFIDSGTEEQNICNLVSIHLMLQFIVFSSGKEKPEQVFQYISCCSLSLMMPLIYSAF